jgi:hypothetical protein
MASGFLPLLCSLAQTSCCRPPLQDLPAADVNGLSDPYIVITITNSRLEVVTLR